MSSPAPDSPGAVRGAADVGRPGGGTPPRTGSDTPPRTGSDTPPRSGNAMARTRGAILFGTRTAITRYGTRRTTMIDIAAVSAVAKATLYNHFRTKSEVYAALGRAEVDVLLDQLTDGAPIVEAVERFGLAVGGHPLVRYLAASEPAVLAAVMVPAAGTADVWESARTTVAAVLADLPDAVLVTELVLRWAASQAFWPDTPEQARRAVKGLLQVALF